MNFKCLFGHQWDGCKCTRCGAIRDEGHKWDGCKCTRCGANRDEGHNWDGCKCIRCGVIRGEGHDWDLCAGKCKKCGQSCPKKHDFRSVSGKCVKVCSVCGERNIEHNWDGYKCTRCGATSEVSEPISGGCAGTFGNNELKCERCKKTVLKRNEFISKLNSMGLNLDSRGNVSASGVFAGYGALQTAQQKVAQLEGDKAIQCKSCSRVYCLDCLVKYASANAQSGGKACFSCGGSLQEM